MDPLISVIVPVYNNKNYISQCIDSLNGQTYKNFEVLLIDDGSAEAFRKIYDQYACEKVRVIHKINGGVSSARNLGLCSAQGEYICFVDSDDCVAPTFLEKLYTAIKTYRVEIAACAYHRGIDADSDYKKSYKLAETSEYYIPSDQKWINVLEDSHSAEGFLWNKMFSKLCIRNLKFDEKLKMSEDMLFVFQALEKVNDIVVVDTPLYFYRINLKSATANKSKEMFEQQIDVAQRVYEIVIRNSDLKTALKYRKIITNARYAYSKWLAWYRPDNWLAGFYEQRKLWLMEDKSGLLDKEEKLYGDSAVVFLGYCIVRSCLSKFKQLIASLR